MPAELEQQPAVDGAEGQLAALGARARARNLVEQPGELGAGEVRVEQQAGAPRDLGFVAGGAQLLAGCGGAPVLPDDGRRHGFAGGAIPEHRGFALIGDADRGEVARREMRGWRNASAIVARCVCQISLRVVLHPARAAESAA